MSLKARIVQLDMLRAVAVLMVVFYHYSPYYDLPEGVFKWPVKIFFKFFNMVGWSGVDLFFVLSGFLVSGLLFREFLFNGKVDVGRFLLRRGLKIYPQFYVFFVFTCGVFYFTEVQYRGEITPVSVLSELLFLQNYITPVWGHTWSLAVEEHFYIILAIVVFGGVKFSKGRAIAIIPFFCVFVFLFSNAMRIFTYELYPYHPKTHLFPTHLRADALMFGVLLSYFYHFHKEVFSSYLDRYRPYLFLLSLTLLSALILWPIGTYRLGVFGLSFIYLGYGGIVMLVMQSNYDSRAWRYLCVWSAFVGRYSYAIYLWHIFAREVVLQFYPNFALYVIFSVLLGVVTTHMVEIPVLRLRDFFFPDKSAKIKKTSFDKIGLSETSG